MVVDSGGGGGGDFLLMYIEHILNEKTHIKVICVYSKIVIIIIIIIIIIM